MQSLKEFCLVIILLEDGYDAKENFADFSDHIIFVNAVSDAKHFSHSALRFTVTFSFSWVDCT